MLPVVNRNCENARMTPHEGERQSPSVSCHGARHFRFYITENHEGKLVKVKKSVKLHDKDREHNSERQHRPWSEVRTAQVRGHSDCVPSQGHA